MIEKINNKQGALATGLELSQLQISSNRVDFHFINKNNEQVCRINIEQKIIFRKDQLKLEYVVFRPSAFPVDWILNQKIATLDFDAAKVVINFEHGVEVELNSINADGEFATIGFDDGLHKFFIAFI